MDAYCKECGEFTTVKIIDHGIGVTEAWGVRTNHVDLEAVTDCCEDFPYTDETCEEVITADDVDKYYEGVRDYEWL